MNDQVKQAAALLGKRGGEKKVPKGFSKTGKASASGSKGNLTRWGKHCRVMVDFLYLPRDEARIMKLIPDWELPSKEEVETYNADEKFPGSFEDVAISFHFSSMVSKATVDFEQVLNAAGVDYSVTVSAPARQLKMTPVEAHILSALSERAIKKEAKKAVAKALSR